MNPTGMEISHSRLNIIFFSLALVWSIMLIAFTGWDYRESYSFTLQTALSTARESYDKDLVFRQWATMHGGVYVPISPTTPPNPYLANIPERDISTPSGKKLTLMNPAYMNRQVFELGEKDYGVLGHITSLKPIRPENAPDDWEKRALAAFEKGQKEIASLETIGKESYLRLMRPLVTESGCLKCHAVQGYKVGDIRGGISVAFPWSPFREALWAQLRLHMLIYGWILAIGLLGLYLVKNWTRNYLSGRKRAEEALIQSEEKFRKAFYTSPDAVHINRLEDGSYVSINPGFTRIMGYTEESIGKTSTEINIWENMEDRQRLIDGLRKNGEITNLEAAFRTKGGELRFGLMSASMITLDGVPHILSITRDITERKQMEMAQRASDEKYRLLFQNNPIPMWVYDTNSLAFLAVNDFAVDHYGYTREEFLGMTIKDIRPPEDVPYLYEVINKYRESLRRVGAARHIKKDGTLFYVEITAHKIDFDGRPAMFVQAMDITDRKIAEEALKASEERLKDIMFSIVDWVWEVDEHGVYTYSSQKAIDLLGKSPEAIVGKTPFDFMPPDEAKRVAAIFSEIVANKAPIKDLENWNIRADGKRICLLTNGVPILDKEGSLKGYRGVDKDITEHKRVQEEKQSLEERLQRSEKMESLGTLAGGVAHDLNNVLGIVVGFSEILLETVDKSSPLRHGLENVMNGGLKAAAIVEDLLTLARRGVQGRSILNLNKIVADHQHSPEFATLLSHHPVVRVKTDLEPDLLNISGSAVHLGKTLYNLISNAGEAMPKGGTVTIKTTNQYLDRPILGYDQIREGDYVVLSVSDTGEGISAQDLKRIFEPFYTKKVMGRSGTGLGLAVVWGTVKDHHGYINVESEEGKGSCFTLYFPVTREDVTPEAAAVAMSAYMGNGETILVVDDVKEQRDLAVSMMSSLNYNLTSVSSGEEAVQYIKNHEVALMVLDMIMEPGMDGLDTYKSILAIHPQQKAIIVSGFSESDRVKEARGLGVGAYVRKPYIKEKLGVAVRKELDRK